MKRILHRNAFLALILAWMGFIPACNYRGAPTAPAVSTEALFTQAWRAFVRGKYDTEPSIAWFESPVLVDNALGTINTDRAVPQSRQSP